MNSREFSCRHEDGITPTFREWNGNGSLVAFVISMNEKRRHMSESQRAMVAAKIATMREGRPDKTSSIELVSQSNAADLLNVGVATVKRARKVLDDCILALVHKVELGEVSVSTAAELADLTAEEQAETLARGEAAILDAAQEHGRRGHPALPELCPRRGTQDGRNAQGDGTGKRCQR